MSALGVPVLINQNRSYWISSISSDPEHNTVTANSAFFSTLSVSDLAQISTLQASSFQLTNDLTASTINTSSFFTNFGKTSTLQWASDLSGGQGYVNITTDPSGVIVTGDPIVFNNLVYLTSTINIVQVSTLVDTDIFAQRGFISSISSLNISANTATFGQANISTIYNNSLFTNDISGSVGFFSTFSTGNLSAGLVSIRQANISTLYVSSLEGVDISGADPTDWANYPAISTILANNNLITGISTLQFQDTARLTSQTGNNLLYNGLPVQYGPTSNVSQWANYPAVNNVNLNTSSISNVTNFSGVNLTLTGSNITTGNTYSGSLGIGGTSLVSLATINSLGQGVLQDLDVGTTLTGIGDLNVYGSNAAPGDNALYVVGGTTLTGGLTGGVPVHGVEIGCLPVAGVDTVRIDVLPAGMGLNSATYIQLAAAGAGSFAAGGALSLAGGSYIELNSDEIRCINSTSGNKNTNLTVGNILSPPDIAATSSLTIQNIAGGGIQIQAGGQGSITGFSTIQGSNLSSINLDVSTINGLDFNSVVTPSNILCSNLQATISVNTQIANIGSNYFAFGFWNQGLAVSTTIGNLRANNILIPDNITGVTNAPNPNQSRIENFSSIQSGTLSTNNLVVSTINGLPWDISGGSSAISTFNQAFTSSLQVSSIKGGGFVGQREILVDGNGFNFKNADVTQNARYLSSLQYIQSPGINLDVFASSINITASQGGSNGYVRVGGGGAFDAFFAKGTISSPSVTISTVATNGFLDLSGGMNVRNDINVPNGKAVGFSGTAYTRLERRDIASNNMLATTNYAGLASNNMAPLGVGEIWLTGGADEYAAVRIYNEFPYTNFGIDQIDADGVTLFEYMYGDYYNTGLNPGYVTVINSLSTVSGFLGDGTWPEITVQDGIRMSTLTVSTINGSPYTPGLASPYFSTLFTSSFEFSTATYGASNTNFNYPIFIDQDTAGNTTTAGVAIAVQGHNFGAGAVVNRLEMGARATGENYIMSVWPGQNLEELYIDATEVVVRDSDGFSTIINSNPHGLTTNGSISTPALYVSSINDLNAQKAYANILQLSSMNLYQNSSTICWWDSISPNYFVNASGYDIAIGQNGNYKIGASRQYNNTGGGTDKVEYYFIKNGVPMEYTNSLISIPNNQETIAYSEIVDTFVNGDIVQLGQYTTSADIYLSTFPGAYVSSPAVIVTIYKVD